MANIECEQCGQELRMPPDPSGKRIRCPTCRFEFTFNTRSSYDQLIDLIFDPDLITNYSEPLMRTTGDIFPFIPIQHPALQWQLRFGLVGFAFCHLKSPEREDLLRHLIRIGRAENRVVKVCTYISDKYELSLLRNYTGGIGWFESMGDQQIPINKISEAVFDDKVKRMMALVNISRNDASYLDDEGHKQVATEYATAILRSYWGRIPLRFKDEYHMDAVTRLVSVTTMKISNLLNNKLKKT